MASSTYIQLQPQVGISRDGTQIDTNQYIDGVWVRFYKDRVKKMGGYKVIVLGDSEIIRNLVSFDAVNSILLYIGQPSHLIVMNVYNDLSTTVPTDRTPVDFVADVNNTWSMTSIAYADADTDESIEYVIATACPNGSDISNTTPGIVYGGVMTSSDRLIPLLDGSDNLFTTGGVVVLGKFLFIYGANGVVIWNDGGSINVWPENNELAVGSSKIVYALPVRQSGAVTGIFWALDYVFSVTATLNAEGEESFTAAYVSTSSTILSPGSVITFDPQFFWIGINNFYVYNGAVSVLPNNTNKLWFFANLNMDARQKVTGFYNKKYNEVCWLAPLFGATENNWMIIYNVETQAWYDTPLNRSCAVSSSSQMPYPIMANSTLETINGSSSYPIWAHEFGVNRIDPVQTTALISSFTTSKFWIIDQNPEAQVLILDAVIPDVKQVKDMFFTVNTQGYPNSPVVVSDNFVMTPTTEFLTVREKGSLISLTFTSNVLDGDFLFGKTMVHLIVSDDKRPGPSVT